MNEAENNKFDVTICHLRGWSLGVIMMLRGLTEAGHPLCTWRLKQLVGVLTGCV